MAKIKFIRQNGGLSRKIDGNDHISGLIVYGDALFAKRLFLSDDELEDAGVTPTSHPVLHYHISEFFRIAPGAKLYAESVEESDNVYSEIKTLQNFAAGDIKQIAICDYLTPVSELANAMTTINEVCAELGDLNIPLSAILSMKVETADMVGLPNVHDFDCDRVTPVLGQDAGGRGNFLSDSNPSLSSIGAILGAVALSKVHESIEWVEKFDLVSTAYEKTLTGGIVMARELDVLGFCDGSLISDYTPAQLESITEKGYVFGIKHVGTTGSFANTSTTAADLESDFLYIENNRTIDKAIRQINKALLPKLSGPAYIDPDTGYLKVETVSALEALASEPLDQMVRNGELSGFGVYINPDQQVLRNSELEVIIKLVPVGTLRKITVKIGLTLKK